MGFFISILVVLAFFTRFYTTLTEEDAFLPDQRSFHFGLVDDLKNVSIVLCNILEYLLEVAITFRPGSGKGELATLVCFAFVHCSFEYSSV